MINFYRWHWTIKIMITVFSNLIITLVIWVIIIHPALAKQQQLQLALRQIKQQNAQITKPDKRAQIVNPLKYYCLRDKDIYAIAQANHLHHIKKKAALLTASADLHSLYYFLETLLLKQSPLTWQSLTITANATNKNYQLTLQWQPLKSSVVSCRPQAQQPPTFFPNQPLDSLTIVGYFTNGHKTRLIVRDRSGKDNEVQDNDYIGAERRALGISPLPQKAGVRLARNNDG